MPGFEGISVTNFMNAWRERSDGEFPPELRALLKDAEKGTRELAKQKLTVRLTGVQVVNNRADFLWMDRKAGLKEAIPDSAAACLTASRLHVRPHTSR